MNPNDLNNGISPVDNSNLQPNADMPSVENTVPNPALVAAPVENTVPNPAPVAASVENTVPNPALVAAPVENTVPNPAPVAAPVENTVPNPAPVAVPVENAVPNPAPVAAPVENAVPNPAPVAAPVGNTVNQINSNASTNNNKTILIIVIACVAIAAAIILVVMFGGKKETKLPNGYTTLKETTHYMKNIEYKEIAKISNKGLLFSVKNNNKDTLSLSIPVKIYNTQDVKVADDTLYNSCALNNETYYNILDLERIDGYARYALDLENEMNAYKTASGEVECLSKIQNMYTVTPELVKEEYSPYYNVTIKNNSDKNVKLEGYLMFSLGDVYVDYKDVYSDLDANGTSLEKVYIPHDSDYNDINYDKVTFLLKDIRVDK